MNETVSFNLVGIAMSGWDEASVDELLADPIVRDLMAADGVDTGELRALLYEVQRTIERYAATRGGPTSLAGFAELYGASPSSTTRADLVGPTLPENRGRSDTRKSRTFLAGRPSLSMAPLGSVVCGEIRCTARS